MCLEASVAVVGCVGENSEPHQRGDRDQITQAFGDHCKDICFYFE